MTTILRYVALCPNENKYKIAERFLLFSPCIDSSGEGITNAIIDELKRFNLDAQNIRGQGYDYGANMAGVIKGVQARILHLNSRARYIPCADHKLNLALNDTAKLSHNNAYNFFEIVQKCFVFFSESPKRWAILQTFAEGENIILKNVSTTRWSSRICHRFMRPYEKLRTIRNLMRAAMEPTIWPRKFANSSSSAALLFGTVFYRK